ncbi:monooxygenase [Alphaproteobacteria bacterium GH1-50]|uniref:Monooxygenase n=1 Tax=Kangsaoukella pontilimi TaxID=2691042 RepID=A0A7C9IRV3_9RHOB|nr:FAD-dependent monooxygenase [Kangsaoukella pontilimi]MXQ07325.1 monooxygenase [Kangsaoukella pontilimi]
MPETYDVLINGGGPVGMGLAIELGQRGHRVCVVERYPEPQPIPKGQNLTQRTAEHFLSWGCEAELRTAHPIPEGGGIGGMTTYGTLLSDYHYDWLNRAHVKDYYFAANARLPQYATERVLRARAAEIPEIDVLYGWSGEALEQDTDGVTLTVGERKGHGTKTLRGKFLVGCDGSRSFTREAAGITETKSEHNRLMALLVFRSEELHELLKRYPGKAFYNVLHPDFEGYWQFFGRVDHGLSWFFHAPVPLGTTEDNHDFRAMLHRAVGQPFELEFEHIGLWDLRVAIADTYRMDRVFIAGDACHSHPPYGGYGINTGFEDVRNLGWKLAATLEGWGGDALLDSYDAERRPVFASTARDFIERFIEEDRTFLNTYNPDTDREAFEAAWHSRNLDADEVNAFEPNYEGSPVIGGDGHPSAKGGHSFEARIGHLLPPPGKDAGAGMLDRIGDGLTLLLAEGVDAEPFETAAGSMALPLTVARLSAGECDAYGTDRILLRPDRFVAWTGADGSEKEVLSQAIGGAPS